MTIAILMTIYLGGIFMLFSTIYIVNGFKFLSALYSILGLSMLGMASIALVVTSK